MKKIQNFPLSLFCLNKFKVQNLDSQQMLLPAVGERASEWIWKSWLRMFWYLLDPLKCEGEMTDSKKESWPAWQVIGCNSDFVE